MKKILVIDDEPDMVKIVKLRLRNNGYEVIVAYNGQDGLYMAHEEKPDLILVDYTMPQMDGLTFLKECKASKSLKKIPCIVLTAHDNAEFDFKNAGATDFMTKPFESDELIAKVQKALKKGFFG